MQPRSAKGADDIRGKKNDTGQTIPAHTVVKLDNPASEMRLPAADTDALYGVTLYDVPDGAIGDVQIRGKALVRAGGTLATTGIELKANTSGQAIAWSASAGDNAHVLGLLETPAGTADDLVEVELAGPGTMKQG